jgi:hypothetical protein
VLMFSSSHVTVREWGGEGEREEREEERVERVRRGAE